MPSCPECGKEFPEGAEKCPACGTSVKGSGKKEETEDFVEVFKADSEIEAEAIEAALDENGIETFMKKTAIPSFPLMGKDCMVTIEVRSDQADAARKIIDELESAPPPEMDGEDSVK